MKVILIMALGFTGCASGPLLTCEEQCSLSGMRCTGMTFTDSGSGGYQSGPQGSPGSFSTRRSSSTTMICAKDAQAADEIQKFREITLKKLEAGPSTREALRKQLGE